MNNDNYKITEEEERKVIQKIINLEILNKSMGYKKTKNEMAREIKRIINETIKNETIRK